MAVTFRDALEEDAAFLLRVYASTREQEIAMVPWSEEQREAFLRMQFTAQHVYYHKQFPDASYQLILKDVQPIGRLYVLREPTAIRILDITILPEHRNTGIGTALIQDLLAEGKRDRKPVGIWVENFNPSLHLFERLGFLKVHEDGLNWFIECPVDEK